MIASLAISPEGTRLELGGLDRREAGIKGIYLLQTRANRQPAQLLAEVSGAWTIRLRSRNCSTLDEVES